MVPGPALYVGVTESGKTTLAVRHAESCASRLRLPLLVVDSFRAAGLSRFPHVGTVAAALSALYAGGPVALFPGGVSGDGPGDVARLCAGARAGGRCVVLLDELRPWITPGRLPAPLSLLFRSYAHSAVALFVTTQSPADLPSEVYQCAKTVFCFRNDSARALRLLGEEFPGAAGRLGGVSVLGRGEFVVVDRSF